MNQDDIQRVEFFNKLFRYKSSKNLLTLTPSAREEFNMFLGVSGIKKGMRAIDFGCGDGRYTLPLLSLGCKVMGIDPAKKAINSLVKNARENKLSRNLKISTTDFTTPQERLNNKYDIGFLISVYHILSNDESQKQTILMNFIHTIRPGGKLILLEPNPLNPFLYFYYFFIHSIPGWHKYQILFSNKWHLEKLIKKLGFEKVKVIPFGFLPGSLVNKYPIAQYTFQTINRLVCLTPLINLFSSFNFYIGKRLIKAGK